MTAYPSNSQDYPEPVDPDEVTPEPVADPQAEPKPNRLTNEVFPPPDEPMLVARKVLPDWQDPDWPDELTLRHWRGQWMEWRRSHWTEVEQAQVRSAMYQRLEHAIYKRPVKGGVALEPWAPTKYKVANLLEAVAAITHLSATIDAPSWTVDVDGLDSSPIVACRNGLLEVGTRKLLEHNPGYLNLVSVPFDYDPAAEAPSRWLAFLEELWPDDDEQVAALQEWFGYVLSGRTNLQKIFLIVGPTRSGKGTIARVLSALLGRANVAGPTLASFGTNFGLSPMLGKPLATITDARLGRDSHQVVERLLTISGEDTITVDRKYREPWTGTMPTRVMILSNELPDFGDSSGVIAHRFIVLAMTESWLGREDLRLYNDLVAELPGILNWSMAGLERLAARQHFTEPAFTADSVVTMKDASSPTSAFVRECCSVGAGLEVDVDQLYARWRSWSEDNGMDRPGRKQEFGRNLRSVVPGLRVERPRDGDERHRVYVGISVRS